LLDSLPVSVYSLAMFTVNLASKILGLDPSHVRRLLISGKIRGKKWGRDWMVLELNYHRKRKIGGGRKKKMHKEDKDNA
jgi:hypothetical protein